MSKAQTLAKLVSDGEILDDGQFNIILPVAKGGTGLATPGADGNILTSNGTIWESKPNSSSAVTVYGYDNRGSLRTLVGTTGKQAIVQGLGLFVYQENSDEPDDDETCFANGTGRWLIETASFDLVDLWNQAENEAAEDYVDSRFADLTNSINGLFIQTTITCTITAVNSTSLASFSTTIVGANVGDSVVVNPPSSSLELAGSPDGLTYFATITAQDTLTVTLVNATASQLGVNTTTQTTPWTVTVIRNL